MTSRSAGFSRAAALLAVALITAASACSSVRDDVVTEANLDAVTSKVTQSSLSVEDRRLFLAFARRVTAARGFGHWSDAKPAYEGKAVAAIIEEERTRQTAAQAGDAQRATNEAAATADAVALASAIGKLLSVAVLETRTAQFSVMPYSYVKLAAQNLSGKEITGFAGRLTIRDLFGEEVAHASINVTESIQSSARITWEELVSDVAVGKASAKHLKFESTPEQVTFQDGSQIGPAKSPTR